MDLWLAILLAAVVTVGSGLTLSGLHRRKVARHRAKIDDRLAAGEDRYFEELRELEAYDPSKRPSWQNVAVELLRLAAVFVVLVLALRQIDF